MAADEVAAQHLRDAAPEGVHNAPLSPVQDRPLSDLAYRVELTPRIVLDRLSRDAEWTGALPHRVRATVAERYALPPLGAQIAFRARLMPVPGPVVPGGYDPRRAAYFDGIGGSGFLFGWVPARRTAGGSGRAGFSFSIGFFLCLFVPGVSHSNSKFPQTDGTSLV